jgi:cellobiose phosphorylase
MVGSAECAEGGQIYLLPQAWAVMANVADRERLVSGMDSVKERLATEHGIQLHQPGYRQFDNSIGSITLYPAGLKENGAIFCHPNPWAVIAETMLGRGDRAFEYYKAILPAAKNEISDIRKTEPYVYCQMIAGKEHTEFGEGKNSWLTGTAAWNLFAVTAYILGVRAEYDGLQIDPAIPASWDGFEVNRRFRNTAYRIQVKNPNHVSKGVKKITVDGAEIQGNVLPYRNDNKEHLVEVVMG